MKPEDFRVGVRFMAIKAKTIWEVLSDNLNGTVTVKLVGPSHVVNGKKNSWVLWNTNLNDSCRVTSKNQLLTLIYNQTI